MSKASARVRAFAAPIAQATVEAIEDGYAQVSGYAGFAELAIPSVAIGDRVLVASDGKSAWVIATLEPRPTRTSDGVAAVVEDDVLIVRAASGAVLFTHSAQSGRSEVRAHGDLHVHAKAGTLQLHADHAVHIAAGEHEALAISAHGTELRTTSFRGTIERAEVRAREATFVAERYESAFEKARQIVGVAELRAHRLVEKLGDAFREVDGVSQTRAQRIRHVARATYHVLANRATVKAEDDLTLLGEKINLS